MIDGVLERFHFAPEVVAEARAAAQTLPAQGAINSHIRAAVLAAFDAERLSESDLWGSFGYGYDDAARERYEALLARVLGAERVLARLSLVSGTHAIVAALSACVAPGERLVVATGRPYDTLRNALVDAPHALAQRGIGYDEIALAASGGVDLEQLQKACVGGCAVVFVQRSRGYAPRRSLGAEECGMVARAVKAVAPNAVVLVDNCYGELVEEREPLAYGADVIMGSLIKNLGGGLAPGGAYVAGKAQLIERVAAYHYAPALGAAVGPTLGFGRSFVQGLFMAPLVIGEALVGLDFVASLFERLGYAVDPAPGATRVDVVQAIRLGDRARVISFTRGFQTALPVNAGFAPEPGTVPGYREPVVMSSGAFVSGSTIDLSCDAPLREPYEMYVQGGIFREHAVLGALRAADALARAGLLYGDSRLR